MNRGVKASLLGGHHLQGGQRSLPNVSLGSPPRRPPLGRVTACCPAGQKSFISRLPDELPSLLSSVWTSDMGENMSTGSSFLAIPWRNVLVFRSVKVNFVCVYKTYARWACSSSFSLYIYFSFPYASLSFGSSINFQLLKPFLFFSYILSLIHEWPVKSFILL